jgi:hypothetical protein
MADIFSIRRSSVKKQLKIPKFWFRSYTFLEQEALLSYNVWEPCKISIRFIVLLSVTCCKLHFDLTFTFTLTCFCTFLTWTYIVLLTNKFILLALRHWSELPSLSLNNHLTISSSATCCLCATVLDEQTTRPCTITSVNKSPACLPTTQIPPLATYLLRIYRYKLDGLWHKSGKGKSTGWKQSGTGPERVKQIPYHQLCYYTRFQKPAKLLFTVDINMQWQQNYAPTHSKTYVARYYTLLVAEHATLKCWKLFCLKEMRKSNSPARSGLWCPIVW